MEQTLKGLSSSGTNLYKMKTLIDNVEMGIRRITIRKVNTHSRINMEKELELL